MPLDDLGVKATDEKTLVVTLEGATPFFPLLAATWTFYPVPKHTVEEYGEAWVEAGNMVSNGPYMLTEWSHDQSMTLERNDAYYGEAPTITTANYTLLADPVAQALVAFEADELDQAQVGGADLDRVKNDPVLGPLVQVFPRSGTEFIICDTTNPPTDNVLVRQALSMALERDALANGVLKGEFSPAGTMLPPDIPGYNPDSALGEDTEKAKAAAGGSRLSQRRGIPRDYPHLHLHPRRPAKGRPVPAKRLEAGPGHQRQARPARGQGVPGLVQLAGRSRRSTSLLNSWGSDWGDPANWHNQLFDSQADFYHSHWKNDEFDTLVREAVTMGDAEARIAKYQQAEALLNQDAALIPVWNLNRIYVVKPYVQGIVHYPILGRTWLRYISILEH